jgi:hypothetical protein
MSTDSVPADAEVPDAVAALREAADALEQAEARVAEFGEAELEALADAHGEFTDILARYEEPATGDGDFQQFIEFQSQIADFVERLTDDILLRETFEECDDRLQQRRLRERDFDAVRANLEPVADLAGRLDDRREARANYRSARNRARHRLQTVRERIDDLERVERLGDADLDAPTDRLRDPIQTSNDAVREAFEAFRREAPARAVLAVVADAQQFPLVEFRAPPPELIEFVETAEVGTEPIPTLLEYAEYSRSKLDHYVPDPGALKTAVRPHTTYLKRLDADPLTVDWPPPAADALVFHCREAERVVARFAPDAVAALRAVRRLPTRTDYDQLREAAVARTELDDAQRDRLRSGEIAAQLEAFRAERDTLAAALEDYPER